MGKFPSPDAIISTFRWMPLKRGYAPQQATTMFFVRQSSHSRSAFISGMIGLLTGSCNLKNTHRQTLLQFLELSSILAANQMSQRNACVYLALVFLALFVLPYTVCLWVFSTLFPKGNELQLPCWVAPP